MFSVLALLLNRQQSHVKKRVESDPSTRMSSPLCLLLFLSLCLVGCSGLSAGTNSGMSSTSATQSITSTSLPQVALANLHWCGKQVLIFRDEGSAKVGTPSGTPIGIVTPATTPQTITDWAQVEPKLGFTVFLPPTLPQGSCLISATGTIHDPTFGGIFTIGYVLPDHDAISLSEAPLASQRSTFQCSPSSSVAGAKSGTPTPSPTFVPIQLCTGARSTTNIVLSARGATASLHQLFNALQPNVSWVPAS